MNHERAAAAASIASALFVGPRRGAILWTNDRPVGSQVYRTPEQAQSSGSDHPHWITVRTTRTVLIVVHTMTAWNRLADILPVFDSDRRVQLVFTFPDVSAVTGDVERQLDESGAVRILWARALTDEFDLAISVHHSGELHRISAPLAVLSHGIGYTKLARESRIENRESRIENRESRTFTVWGGGGWCGRDRFPKPSFSPTRTIATAWR
ncbi:hypothetical protein [Nocardia lasii]|uniref:Uncharacterized protein n=1 Tax=Nocardia lasii TaxID=1616107 RepID=A0ABW1JNU1_9NOCA